ncbi:hypothetical protein QJS04_geneDACA016589 [Acorus gramineus]|uniref:Uncharacterized protein n=1 Tax=Acorus gramineus TaxID=55184 RepID=A0AAV9BQ72_ACOGR|nr:hypothetical protein QJS04_geneDACA016589 [Acorus gramineus]
MRVYGSNLKGADFSRTFKGKHNRDDFFSFSTRTFSFDNYTKYAPARTSIKDKKENPFQVLSDLKDNNNGKFSKYTTDGRCNSSADHQVHIGHGKTIMNRLSQTHPYKGVTAKVFLGIEQPGDEQFKLDRQHSNSINDKIPLQHRVLLKVSL